MRANQNWAAVLVGVYSGLVLLHTREQRKRCRKQIKQRTKNASLPFLLLLIRARVQESPGADSHRGVILFDFCGLLADPPPPKKYCARANDYKFISCNLFGRCHNDDTTLRANVCCGLTEDTGRRCDNEHTHHAYVRVSIASGIAKWMRRTWFFGAYAQEPARRTTSDAGKNRHGDLALFSQGGNSRRPTDDAMFTSLFSLCVSNGARLNRDDYGISEINVFFFFSQTWKGKWQFVYFPFAPRFLVALTDLSQIYDLQFCEWILEKFIGKLRPMWNSISDEHFRIGRNITNESSRIRSSTDLPFRQRNQNTNNFRETKTTEDNL